MPPHFAVPRRKPVLCIIRAVPPYISEEFALRILLRNFPARGWGELRTRNGILFGTFSEAALAVGLVGDVNQLEAAAQ
jgi:hypothetical protein